MGMLDGRVALVTGGGRGLGRAHCLELAAHGAIVVVNDPGVTTSGGPGAETPADEVVAAIGAVGGHAKADRTSVSDWQGVEALIARIVAEYGHLDVVVNNAGILRDRMITSMSEADFDAVVAVHLKGSFCVTKHACDHWRARVKAGEKVSGRIINTTSGTGLFGTIGQANYGAAKAGITSLTTITAMEMERYGVTANAISPIAATRMTASAGDDLAREMAPGWDPLDPANASPVVAWLASEDSGWLTGAILRIAGNNVQRVRPFEIDWDATYTAKGGERLELTELPAGLRGMYKTRPMGAAAVRKK